MLILTRKKDQGVVINGGIEVFVAAIEGNKVKLGIKAPKEVSIIRSELMEAVKGENKAANDIGAVEIDFSAFKPQQD
ncbi:carbon storage regulator [Metallumcola ferriviriculae]|uniref:Translational regulator CsrA n=1 Tax=Metallumcola ferriviriculae TaxID=3039180 RepID=A0AAU0UTM5_9FIRM|nr:carbon storage regulator [Desulfitibacteraceae bacterium MK1]